MFAPIRATLPTRFEFKVVVERLEGLPHTGGRARGTERIGEAIAAPVFSSTDE